MIRFFVARLVTVLETSMRVSLFRPKGAKHSHSQVRRAWNSDQTRFQRPNRPVVPIVKVLPDRELTALWASSQQLGLVTRACSEDAFDPGYANCWPVGPGSFATSLYCATAFPLRERSALRTAC